MCGIRSTGYGRLQWESRDRKDMLDIGFCGGIINIQDTEKPQISKIESTIRNKTYLKREKQRM